MLLDPSGSIHLTYCTNIHPADGWAGVDANLKRFAPALKARLSPKAPFGVGLRLSARDATELLADHHINDLCAFLEREGLYVAIINGFPYGSFHRTAVKADVYAPDWRDERRVAYTLALVDVLDRLLPRGTDGGVSTAPLSYKAWMAPDAPGIDADWRTVTTNVARVAVALARIRERDGRLIHLDVEPEPDCVLETVDETIAFFERWLWPHGAAVVADAMGIGQEEARRVITDHVRVCFDCCHAAVEYEEPIGALDRLEEAGIKIGRVQLSSALTVPAPRDEAARAALAARLRPFADSTYLHQVIERNANGLRHYPDLGPALDDTGGPSGEWRIHFHVPLFASEFGELGSTQQDVRTVAAEVVRRRLSSHLEIETYTWDVLPAGLKLDLFESIAREFEWVLEHLRPAPHVPV